MYKELPLDPLKKPGFTTLTIHCNSKWNWFFCNGSYYHSHINRLGPITQMGYYTPFGISYPKCDINLKCKVINRLIPLAFLFRSCIFFYVEYFFQTIWAFYTKLWFKIWIQKSLIQCYKKVLSSAYTHLSSWIQYSLNLFFFSLLYIKITFLEGTAYVNENSNI